MTIETILGPMDERELEPFTETDDTEDRVIVKTGYRYCGAIVQQDVVVVFKKLPEFDIVTDMKP